jgi:hypothetical protein
VPVAVGVGVTLVPVKDVAIPLPVAGLAVQVYVYVLVPGALVAVSETGLLIHFGAADAVAVTASGMLTVCVTGVLILSHVPLSMAT